MAKQKIEVEVDIPSGFEATGKYRKPTAGEWYLYAGRADLATYTIGYPYLILRRVEPKRESRWRRVPEINDYVPSHLYCTKEDAGINCNFTVERIDYENGVPVSATLEPKEQ